MLEALKKELDNISPSPHRSISVRYSDNLNSLASYLNQIKHFFKIDNFDFLIHVIPTLPALKNNDVIDFTSHEVTESSNKQSRVIFKAQKSLGVSDAIEIEFLWVYTDEQMNVNKLEITGIKQGEQWLFGFFVPIHVVQKSALHPNNFQEDLRDILLHRKK